MKNGFFQFGRLHLQPSTGHRGNSLGMTAIVNDVILSSFSGKSVSAVATEHFAFQEVIMLLLLRQMIFSYGCVCPVEQVRIYNGRVMIGNFEPFAFILFPYSAAANFLHCVSTNDIGADIPFIRQDTKYSRT